MMPSKYHQLSEHTLYRGKVSVVGTSYIDRERKRVYVRERERVRRHPFCDLCASFLGNRECSWQHIDEGYQTFVIKLSHFRYTIKFSMVKMFCIIAHILSEFAPPSEWNHFYSSRRWAVHHNLSNTPTPELSWRNQCRRVGWWRSLETTTASKNTARSLVLRAVAWVTGVNFSHDLETSFQTRTKTTIPSFPCANPSQLRTTCGTTRALSTSHLFVSWLLVAKTKYRIEPQKH